MSKPAPSISRRISRKASLFTESVIREMTREAMKYGAVNLSQGFPDFPAPEDIKRVAMQAIADDVNQYAITWGAKDFREAIARTGLSPSDKSFVPFVPHEFIFSDDCRKLS